MQAELSTLSFICAALLALRLLSKNVRNSVTALSIVIWLCTANLVHGINALVWAGNVNIHIPVWCDIVTRVVLCAMVAVPSAYLATSYNLRLIISEQKISVDARACKLRKLLDFGLCYALPAIYLIFHFISQNARFDLLEDYGCFASIQPSAELLIFMQAPPVIISAVSLIFSALAIHSYRGAVDLDSRLSSRANMSVSMFVRRLTMSTIMSIIQMTISLACLFKHPQLEVIPLWQDYHLTERIFVVKTRDKITQIQIVWWSLIALSVSYLVLSLFCEEEYRTGFESIRAKISQYVTHSLPSSGLLPSSHPLAGKLSQVLSPTRSPPVTVELSLKSGWDDMLDIKGPKRVPSSRKTAKSPSPSSTGSSSSRPDSSGDDVFMTSTISYLGSPTAQALGLASPPSPSPSPIFNASPKLTHEVLPMKSVSPTPSSFALNPKRSHRPDVPSTISLVLEAPWPAPPATPPPSSIRTHSPAPSADSTFGYPLYPTVTPPYLRTRPFEGSSISSAPDSNINAPTGSQIPSAENSIKLSRRPSLKGLQKTWSRERMGHAYTTNEVVHMSVVQETV